MGTIWNVYLFFFEIIELVQVMLFEPDFILQLKNPKNIENYQLFLFYIYTLYHKKISDQWNIKPSTPYSYTIKGIKKYT